MFPYHTQIREAIEYVQAQGIVQGYSDGTFRPDQTINRAEFIKIIAESWVAADPGTGHVRGIYPCFFHETKETFLQRMGMSAVKDVDFSAWYGDYLCHALGSGIIRGYPDGTIRPGQTINFVEAAKIIAVAFNLGLDPSEDQPWYQPYVIALEGSKAIPISILSFDQQITRGEMAEMIYRLQAGVTTKPSRTYEELAGVVSQQWQTVRMGGYSVEVPQEWSVSAVLTPYADTFYRSFFDGSGNEIGSFFCPPPEIGYEGSNVVDSKKRLLQLDSSKQAVFYKWGSALEETFAEKDAFFFHVTLGDTEYIWENSCQLSSVVRADEDIWLHIFESASIAH